MKNALSLITQQQQTSIVCGCSYYDYNYMELSRCLDYAYLGLIANVWESFSNFIKHHPYYD